ALTPEQQAVVQQALRDRGFKKAITGAEATHRNIQRLQPGKWLDDEVINFHMNTFANANGDEVKAAKLAARRARQAYGYWNVHAFITGMYTRIEEGGHKAVARWTKKVGDVFVKDRLLFPINRGQSHWVCACINLRERRFEFYDSMAGGSWEREAAEHLSDWLVSEWRAKKAAAHGGRELDVSGWQRYTCRTNPQQRNGYDCGVFSVLMIEQLSRRDPKNIPYFRQRMIYEISSEYRARPSVFSADPASHLPAAQLLDY
ncbi:cysteine proteinase, partial [Tilletiopsis washingtonensis]